jgi:hypothetical protein
MPLLNYWTTVAADKTAAEIIRKVAAAGATQILTDYQAGRPTGVAFALHTPAGVRQYRLPVDVAAVEKVMRAYGSGVQRRYQNRDQAERVAWRIMKDWAEAQLAIIETHMLSVDQVFLPYMLVDGSTVYDLYLTQLLALGTGDG